MCDEISGENILVNFFYWLQRYLKVARINPGKKKNKWKDSQFLEFIIK